MFMLYYDYYEFAKDINKLLNSGYSKRSILKRHKKVKVCNLYKEPIKNKRPVLNIRANVNKRGQ